MSQTSLHYITHGSGSRHLICFHGFGQDHSAFSSYAENIKGYKIYFFDLYYHGKSDRADRTLTAKEWLEDFKDFLATEQIEQFSLLSFSLGGRFILALLTQLHERIEHIILLAPDGIIQPLWYRIATHPLGNWLFKKLMSNDRLFDNTLNFLEKTHLASNTLVRFARNELPTAERRKQVYQTWTYFKPLQQQLSDLRPIFQQLRGEAHVILGSKDAILKVEEMRHILDSLPNLKIHVVDAKHHQMIKSSKSLVSSLLKGE